MIRDAALLLLVIAVGGCQPRPIGPLATATSAAPLATPPAPALSTQAPSAAALPAPAPTAAARPTLAKTGVLVVADENGLREVGYDGVTIRLLSKTPAARPRFFHGGKEILFYVQSAGEVRGLTRETGVERRVAVVPSVFKTCGKMPDYPVGYAFGSSELNVQSDHGFALDADGSNPRTRQVSAP